MAGPSDLSLGDLAEELAAGARALSRLADIETALGVEPVSPRLRDAIVLDALETLGQARSATETAVRHVVIEAITAKAASHREVASLAGVAFTTAQRWIDNGGADHRRRPRAVS